MQHRILAYIRQQRVNGKKISCWPIWLYWHLFGEFDGGTELDSVVKAAAMRGNIPGYAGALHKVFNVLARNAVKFFGNVISVLPKHIFIELG